MTIAAIRRHDIDWLRILASYLVVIYHTAQFFDFQQKAYIKNRELSWSLDVFTKFVYLWHMPLFFLVSGWSSKFSLSSRGVARFVAERAQKLIVPLLFGLFALCAPPQWVALRHGRCKTTSGELLPAQPTVSFASFLQLYYFGEGMMSWGHLWFLAYLFTFTVLYLPGFWVLSKMDFVEKWTHGRLGWVMGNTPMIVLAVIQLTFRDRWPGYQNLIDDWGNFWFYSTFFMTGFCLAKYPQMEVQLNASWRGNLAIGTLSSLVYLLPSLSFGYFKLSTLAQHLSFAAGSWYMVLFFLSYSRGKFSGRAPPSFWSRHAFPVYVVHDVPLSLLADGLLPSHAPILMKFVSLAGSALLLTLLMLPRHMGFLRLLVGMRKESSNTQLSDKVE